MKHFFAMLLASTILFAGISSFAGSMNPEATAISHSVKTHFTKGKPGKAPFAVSKVSTSGPYALANWVWGEAGGQAALQKKQGKWVVLTAGGGQVDEKTLIKAGIPASYAKALTQDLK
jgi:hypothetical protein